MKETLAERYRRHREVFLLARELGCLPCEAEVVMRRRTNEERHRAVTERLAAKMNAPLPRPMDTDRQDEPRQPWWMKD